MLSVPGFQTLSEIHSGVNSIAYRAVRSEDGMSVVVKIPRADYPPPGILDKFRREAEISSILQQFKSVIHVYELKRHGNTLAMVMEDFGAKSLKDWLSEVRPSLGEILDIASAIVSAMSDIHSAQVIHKDINPSNIIIHPETRQVKIIDFGISTLLPRESPLFEHPRLMEGTLGYISPEQTGRMNRSVDFRADYYSFGVTLYELLVGHLPFTVEDENQLILCHLAKRPPAPHELKPDIPQSVSAIVMKLLAKVPEERYQSAFGLLADLTECREQLRVHGAIRDFEIGTRDLSDRLIIPQKLYGREEQIATLHRALEEDLAGQRQIVLVSGYSGIGKTVLVQELFKPLTRRKGFFITGKFDRLKRHKPYTAIADALRQILRQLMMEPEKTVESFKKAFLETLGPNVSFMTELVPELEWLVGKQAKAADVLAAERQNRFNLALAKFVQVVATADHPVVLFLDDLQWADTATLGLLEQLLGADNPACLFFVGTFRDSEVSETHPLWQMIRGLEAARCPTHHLRLKPLALAHINELLVETLHRAEADVALLGALLEQKTAGNPFFLNEYLHMLREQGLLTFDSSCGQWRWNLEQIQTMGITENVAQFMSERMRKLPASSQKLLMTAACLGNKFDLQSLRDVLDQPQEAIAEAMKQLLIDGLMLPLGHSELLLDQDGPVSQTAEPAAFRFSHDRVQQSAYDLIPEADKRVWHHRMGERLLKKCQGGQLEQRLFDIVNHLNLAVDLITEPAKREELARLNLLAGKKAKEAAAYEPGFRYLSLGLTLLSPDCWQSQYDLAMPLHEEAAEAARLITDFKHMFQWTDAVVQHAHTLLEKVRAFEIRIEAYAAQHNLAESAETGITVLSLLGIRFPKKPTKRHVILGLIRTKLALLGKSIPALENLPPMKDVEHLTQIRIMRSLASVLYITNPMLAPLMAFKQLLLVLKHGNMHLSPSIYSAYGLILCGGVGDVENGYQFGRLALRLAEGSASPKHRCRTMYVVNAMVLHWKEPLKNTLKSLRDAYQLGLDTGDYEYAAYNINMYCNARWIMGTELGELAAEMQKYSHSIRQIRQGAPLSYNEIFRQATLNLMGQTEDPLLLSGEAFDEHKEMSVLREANNATALFCVSFHKVILANLFQRYHEAQNHVALGEGTIDSVRGTILPTRFRFHVALAHLGAFNLQSPALKKKSLHEARRAIRLFEKWARHCPVNHRHLLHLLQAELLRVQGKGEAAIAQYDLAIAQAKECEYLGEEALALQLAGAFYQSQKNARMAESFLQDATYAFLKWGARSLVAHMENRYAVVIASS